MKYQIVGYGSLLSHKSLQETLQNKHFHPVIVKGYKRIFNVMDCSSKNPDVLNLKKSKNHFFNGVLFEVNDKELAELKKREDCYNLEETKCYDFKTKKPLGKCLLCIDHHLAIDHHHKNPNKGYFILCREAAYHISKKFGLLWDKTTFTSKNEKISDWIKEHKEYNTLR
ncbi:MAG: gamma-glutamylcyclotransferase [Nanoarchaeota archaeon]|nr:gamma-glutamylcyclotransferase [Nanoarchaeota archaeon]MBU0977124.1 gamma-glutamylcyclotransferase [Nanoarchaeota archaeon]